MRASIPHTFHIVSVVPDPYRPGRGEYSNTARVCVRCVWFFFASSPHTRIRPTGQPRAPPQFAAAGSLPQAGLGSVVCRRRIPRPASRPGSSVWRTHKKPDVRRWLGVALQLVLLAADKARLARGVFFYVSGSGRSLCPGWIGSAVQPRRRDLIWEFLYSAGYRNAARWPATGEQANLAFLRGTSQQPPRATKGCLNAQNRANLKRFLQRVAPPLRHKSCSPACCPLKRVFTGFRLPQG